MATSFEVTFEFRNQRFDSAATGLRAFYDIIAKDWDGSAKVLSVELRNFLNQVVDAIVSRNSAGWPGGIPARWLIAFNPYLPLLVSIVSLSRKPSFGADLPSFKAALSPHSEVC